MSGKIDRFGSRAGDWGKRPMFRRIGWGLEIFEARLAGRLHDTHEVSSIISPSTVWESLHELSPKPDLTRDDPAKPDIVPVPNVASD